MADAVTAALLKESGQAPQRMAGNPQRVSFSVAEEAASAAEVRSPEARSALTAELGRKDLHPVARKALQAEYDANFGEQTAQVSAPQQAANDPITAALLNEAKPSRPEMADVPGTPEHEALLANRPSAPSTWERVKTAFGAGPVGPAEAALTMGTGAVGSALGAGAGLAKGLFGGKYGTPEGAREAAAYAQEVAKSLTYEPRTEAGKEVLAGIGDIAEQTGATRLAGIGPAEGMALGNAISQMPKGAITQGTKLALGMDKAKPTAAAGAAAGASGTGAMGSVGAAGVNPKEAALNLASQAQTPQLKQAIERAAPKMSPTGLKAAERHIEADTLPVPVKLTAGQATQDVTLLSQEQNARGTKEALAKRFNEQNAQLGENLREIRDRAAPDVFDTSKAALGETIIDSYKAKDAALNKNISALYKQLEDANGGHFPLDSKALVANADAQLHKQLLYDHVPGPIRSTLDRLSREGMTFENFESLRTRLAAIQRSQTYDGNAKAAAGVIRDSLEALPMPAGAEHLKPLADAARAAAKERFDLLKADPAFNAVVKGKASADRFIEKYVLNADKKAVETMKTNLVNDAVAQQSMTAGALKRLEDRAGLIDYAGNFSPAGYNKALEGLGQKAAILFEPETKSLVEKLGRVGTYVKGQPTGSFVNNSNTAVTLLGEAAKSGAAGAANVAAHGIPVGTWTRKIAGFVKEQKDLNRSLQTGAGLSLKELSK